MAKVSQLRDSEDAICPVDHHAVGGKELEDLAQVIGMIRRIRAGHKDVVEVDQQEMGYCEGCRPSTSGRPGRHF